MAAYKRTDKKGWYISFYFQNKKIKLMNWRSITGINKPFDSKTEALQAEARYKVMLENPIDQITLYNLYDEYIANTKSSLKPSTLKHYSIFKRNYLILIPDKKIIELSVQDIQKWKNKFYTLELDAPTVNRYKNIMLQLLKYGSQMYDIKARLQVPLLEIYKNNKPKAESKNKYIVPKDFTLLVKPLKDNLSYGNFLYYYTIFIVLYNTGIRIGELAALTIDDFKIDYIIINKDYVRVNQSDIIQTTKSTNSIRKVYLDSETKEIILKYIEVYKPTNIIFKLEKEYLTQQTIRSMLKKLGRITELDKIYELKIHNLRHSHASNLRMLGYDEYAISKRLGNTPNIAATTYIHAKDDELIEMAQKIEKIKKIVPF